MCTLTRLATAILSRFCPRTCTRQRTQQVVACFGLSDSGEHVLLVPSEGGAGGEQSFTFLGDGGEHDLPVFLKGVAGVVERTPTALT